MRTLTGRGGSPAARRGPRAAVLAHRDFRYLALAFGQSQIGDFLFLVALVGYVYDSTHSTAWVSALTVLRALPMVLLQPLAGALADRCDRRRLLIWCDVSRATVMAGLTLAVMLDAPVVWVVVLAVLTAVLSTPYGPANAALVPSVVPAADLVSANTVLASIDAITLLVGPAAGSVLLLLGSAEVVLLVNCATFVVSAVLLLRITDRPLRPLGKSTGRPGVLAGFSALNHSQSTLLLCAGYLVACLTLGQLKVLYVLVTTRLLGSPPTDVGWLFSAAGAGGLIAAALVGRLARSERVGRLVTLCLVFMSAGTMPLALTGTVAVAYALVGTFAAAMAVADVLTVTLLQRTLDNAELGRAFGALRASAFALMLAGALIAPLAVEALGLRGALLAAGALPLGVALVTHRRFRRIDATAVTRLDTIRRRLQGLERNETLSGLSRPQLERLAGASEEQTAPAGRALIAEGEQPDDLFVIVEGEVEVTARGEGGGPPRRIGVLGPGDQFGEIGLLARMPRTATITATSDTRVLRINGDTFVSTVLETPTVAADIGETARARLTVTHPVLASGRSFPLD